MIIVFDRHTSKCSISCIWSLLIKGEVQMVLYFAHNNSDWLMLDLSLVIDWFRMLEQWQWNAANISVIKMTEKFLLQTKKSNQQKSYRNHLLPVLNYNKWTVFIFLTFIQITEWTLWQYIWLDSEGIQLEFELRD
jgi:hypothetical protein